MEAQITDQGWSAEFAIPFLALRYGSGDSQTWVSIFSAISVAITKSPYWAPLDRNFNLNRVSEAGYIEGIEVPSQRLLQVTPYALSLE